MNEMESNGSRLVLKWWPIIFAFITWALIGFGGFFTLRSEVEKTRIETLAETSRIKTELSLHKDAQVDATTEQNRRLERIENLLYDMAVKNGKIQAAQK